MYRVSISLVASLSIIHAQEPGQIIDTLFPEIQHLDPEKRVSFPHVRLSSDNSYTYLSMKIGEIKSMKYNIISSNNSECDELELRIGYTIGVYPHSTTAKTIPAKTLRMSGNSSLGEFKFAITDKNPQAIILVVVNRLNGVINGYDEHIVSINYDSNKK